jgi:hypothetical protein
MKRDRTLGVFAKQPTPGGVKTRLAAATSPAWAAQVYEAFFLDLLDRLQALPVRRVLAYAPDDAVSYFQGLVRGRFELVPQGSGDLGQRIPAFFHRELGKTEAVVLIGTDSPTLPLRVINQAFDELQRAELVLGPAADGGYYLIGCARRVPAVFEGVEWGTSRVLEQTIALVQRHQISFRLLPPWYDVDTLEDWQCLRAHVAALRCAGVDPGIPRTEALLDASAKRG